MPSAPVIRLGSVTLSRDDFFAAGGRYLIRGDTFELHHELTACGCEWSADERAWVADHDAADRVVALLRPRRFECASFGTHGEAKSPPSVGLAEEPCVTGWTRLGLPADPHTRRMNRLARLPPEHWADEEVLEILLGQASP